MFMLEVGKSIKFIGRILRKRKGKFINFFDVTYNQNGQFFSIEILLENYDFSIGDIIEVSGIIEKNNLEQFCVRSEYCTLINSAGNLSPNNKIVDFPSYNAMFRNTYFNDVITRLKAINVIRTFLLQHDFLEVDTSILQEEIGSATSIPFETCFSDEKKLYLRRNFTRGLRKNLSILGTDIFEIGKVFRNHNFSTKTLPEYTMLEGYKIGKDHFWAMNFVEELLHCLVSYFPNFNTTFSFPLERLDFNELFDTIVFSDFDAVKLKKLKGDTSIGNEIRLAKLKEKLFDQYILKKTYRPTFFYGFPACLNPLSINENDTSLEAKLIINGINVTHICVECTNFDEQQVFFESQYQYLLAKGNFASHETEILASLKYGLYPFVSFGIGIDRLLMAINNNNNIKDVLL